MAEPYTIGLITTHLTGTYSSQMVHGVVMAAHELGACLVIYVGNAAELAHSGVARERVDGWITLPPINGVATLVGWDRPVVTIGEPAPAGVACGAVLADNADGMRMVVEHLLNHGHTTFAFVGFFSVSDFRERYAGFCATLTAHGIDPAAQHRIETGGYHPSYAQAAVQQALASGMQFTALVAADDDHAIGALAALTQAGLRVPEDVAVIGFDDTPESQATEPPLSTVRQRFDEQSRIAVRLLIDQLQGQAARDAEMRSPTALIVRRSCGCRGLVEARTPQVPQHDSLDWQAALAHAVVSLAIFPHTPAPNQTPESIWRGVTSLVSGLEDTLNGQASQIPESTWEGLYVLAQDLLTLGNILDYLEEAGLQRVLIHDQPRTALDQYLRMQRQQALSYFQAKFTLQRQMTDRIVALGNQIVMVMVGRQPGSAWNLSWMGSAGVESGCLALLEGDQARIIAQFPETDTPLSLGMPTSLAAFPPQAYMQQLRPGMTMHLIPTRATRGQIGMLAVAWPSSNAINDSSSAWGALIGSVLEREQLDTLLKQEHGALEQAYLHEHQLAQTIRELGCLVLPLGQGILLVPLIGAIDSMRSLQIAEIVLLRVTQDRATHVLFDVTGVAIIDTHVAALLIQTARAVGLLGAQAVLVGIRPEIAQSIVGLGVDLHGFTRFATLEHALAAIRHRADRLARRSG